MQNEPANPQNHSRIRIALFMVPALLASLLVIVWLNNLLSTGKLEVITSNNNLIELKRDNQAANLKQAYGKLSVSLGTGKYVIVVSDRTAATRQLITIKGHSTAHYQINVQGLIDPEPVLPYGAYGVFADDSQLLFASMQDHHLYRVGQAGGPSTIDNKNSFGRTIWQNANYGVAENLTEDSLYSISGGAVNNIKLPFSSGRLLFGLAGGRLVVSDGKSIYINNSGSFTKIYSGQQNISSMTVGKENILVGLGSSTKSNRDEQAFKILGLDGKTGSSLETSAYSSSWSRDGKYLAITNDSSTTIYNNRFNVVGQLPDKNVLGMTWLNASTLLYGVGSNIFSYDTANSRSSQLSSSGGAGVSGIFPSSDGSQIYILNESVGTGQTYALSRINLNKAPPDYLHQLGLFLPVQLSGCTASYINFSQPQVTVTAQAASSPANCLQLVKNYLAKDGLDVDKFGYFVSP